MRNEKCRKESKPAYRVGLTPFLFSLFSFLFLFACSSSDRRLVDHYNSLSYAYHYRNLDSTAYFAEKAYQLAGQDNDAKAEALNNLAFVNIIRMRYDEAARQLDSVTDMTDNQVECLVAEVQKMRLCQRRSNNRAFYDHREQAQRSLMRINEERESLSDRMLRRLIYAESELAIVTSTYFYYIGLEQHSKEALLQMPDNLEQDTAQFLNYLYNVGAGGIIDADTQEEVNQKEFEYLIHCYLLALQTSYPFFAANSLEALAEHLTDSLYREQLVADNLPTIKYLNTMGVDFSDLPIELADQALGLFKDYGDVYQIAGAYRSLASCFRSRGDYPMALANLQMALSDTIINQAPDLVASIREQMSVAYAAIDDKTNSDLNRNLYLDLQEQTRQDRSLEARAGQLEQSLSQLNYLLWAIGGALFILALLIGFSYFLRRKGRQQMRDDELSEREDELREQLAQAQLHLDTGERRHLEQRAKLSLVVSIMPLIDRMIHAVKTMPADEVRRKENLQYIGELIDSINEQNDVLTHWIQLRQGDFNLHIETFPLQDLFDIVSRSKRSFSLKGITLTVENTSAHVKADRVLTLFMLNTLADNARKFTAEGGQVNISAMSADDYVEIVVSDTGVGISEDKLAHVFDHTISSGHGFGLLNCKGIIDKYRKMSQIFSVCRLDAKSKVGEGSQFSFRLPRGLVRTAMSLVFALFSTINATANSQDYLTLASAYADSTFNSNVEGTYSRTLELADSCRYYLNKYYLDLYPSATDTLPSIDALTPIISEIGWLHNGVKLNYDIILIMRNEVAVAALALHRWQLYSHNNRIFTQLFKELSADSTLDDYCRKMQQSSVNKQIAIILLVLLFICIIVAVCWQLLISVGRAAQRQQEYQNRLELLQDSINRIDMEVAALHVSNSVMDNCLSTLKHETMYYPSHIRQLIQSGDTESLTEVVDYYRELYAILTQQAMGQIGTTKIHLKPLPHHIFADNNLLRYLLELLKKQNGQQPLSVSYQSHGDNYVDLIIPLPALSLSQQQAHNLFVPATDHIPYLICRQIMRDHGEAANRRSCAIKADVEGGQVTMTITLPSS